MDRSSKLLLERALAAGALGLFLFRRFSLPRPAVAKDSWMNNVGTIIGHRGSRTELHPTGNTMGSFEAGAANSTGLELDIQLMADDELVVFHDLTTKKHLCGPTLTVMDMTYPEIATREFTHKMDRDERVPTLGKVIEFAKANGLKLVVEMKGWRRHAEHAERLVKVLREHDFECDTMVISFNPVLLYCLRRISAVPFALISQADLFTHLAGLDVSCVPLSPLLLKPLDALYDWAALTPSVLPAFLGATGMSTWYPCWTERLVRNAKAAGLSTNAWTVNSQEVADRLRCMGMNLITTDLPTISFKHLESRE